jgi:hypothetical protein
MQEFEGALLDLVKEICDLLINTPMPLRPWTRIIKTDLQTTAFPVELRLDFNIVLQNIFRISHQLDSLNRVVNIVDNDPKLFGLLAVDAAGQPIQDAAARHQWVFNSLAVTLLTKYFDKKKKFLFDNEVFQEVYDEFMTEVNFPTIQVTSLRPLLNLHLAVERLEIGSGLCLRKLAPEEIEDWINLSFPALAPPISILDVTNIQCAIEVKITPKMEGSLTNEAILNLSDRLINVLHLFTNKRIYILFTQQSQAVNRPLFPQISQSWNPSLRLHGEIATIDDTNAKDFVNLWKALETSPNSKYIDLALKRWAATVERLSDEDKLIDYWVALESLFTTDSSQEVTYRASLRIAAFLGKSIEERQQIYNDIRHSYNWRSAIVHGDTKEPRKIKNLNKKGSLPDITSRTRSYLRNAILKLIASDVAFEPAQLEMELLTRL